MIFLQPCIRLVNGFLHEILCGRPHLNTTLYSTFILVEAFKVIERYVKALQFIKRTKQRQIQKRNCSIILVERVVYPRKTKREIHYPSCGGVALNSLPIITTIRRQSIIMINPWRKNAVFISNITDWYKEALDFQQSSPLCFQAGFASMYWNQS